MSKPSFAEIAAFKDLTKKQQDAYIKAHPKSKFNPASKQTSGARFNAGLKSHLIKAIKSGKEAHKHMHAYNAAKESGDHKATVHHDEMLTKHKADFAKHLDKAEEKHHADEFRTRVSPRNGRRFEQLEEMGDAIDHHYTNRSKKAKNK